MKAIRLTCLVLLFAATACVAQMYTVTDLGTIPGDSSLSGGDNSESRGINASGQVVGASMVSFHLFHAWRTAPNRPINPATDDLGTQVPGSGYSDATAINASGQVTGTYAIGVFRSYRTAPNSPINPTTDDLGTLGASSYNHAYGINTSGQVVGTEYIYDVDDGGYHAFRTAPNSRINPATDDLGTLAPGGHNSKGSGDTYASGINDFGQVVGTSDIGMDVPFGGTFHAFRTAPNSPINPITDDLGTLGGTYSSAAAVNNNGEVVGYSYLPGDIVNGVTIIHAFRTAPHRAINPATDDLGTLVPGGWWTFATAINNYGEVVGSSFINADDTYHAFVYSNSVMHDLNNLISAASCKEISTASSINDHGQIAANASCNGQNHAVRLDPIYKAFVQPPIKPDGISVFNAKRRVIPVKFSLAQSSLATCNLLSATITLTRAAGGTLIAGGDGNTQFRTEGCQYHYNLAASTLGPGTYRVDISINGIMVGHAVFTLR